MANLIHFGVGQIREEFKNNQDGPQFEMTDSGLLLLIFFNKPTDEEIRQISEVSSFEIRYTTTIKDIIMFSFKAGNLSWSDAPYSTHLSPDGLDLSYPPQGMGLALNVILIDSSTGEIKSIRLLSLSNFFSKLLLDAVRRDKLRDFNKDVYMMEIDNIYAKYTTREIVSRSKDYFRIN